MSETVLHHPLPDSLADRDATKPWFELLGKPLSVLAAFDAVSLIEGLDDCRERLARVCLWVHGRESEDSCIRYGKELVRGHELTKLAAARVLWCAGSRRLAADEAASALEKTVKRLAGLETAFSRLQDAEQEDWDEADRRVRASLDRYTRLPALAVDLSHQGTRDPAARLVMLDVLYEHGWPAVGSPRAWWHESGSGR